MDEKGLFGRASSVADGARAFYRARKTEVSPPFGRDFMSFRRAFTAFAVSLTVPAAAMAQEARQIELGYEITFAGISGFRIDVTARFNGTTYDVESSTFKVGTLKAMTMNYVGRNRAWGGFSAQGARPSAGSLSIMVGDTPRTWLAQYGASGFLQETHTPVWKPTAQQAIPEGDKQGSLDPLSAALSVGLAGDAACDKPIRTNDGKRRIDVMLSSTFRDLVEHREAIIAAMNGLQLTPLAQEFDAALPDSDLIKASLDKVDAADAYKREHAF